MNDLLWWRTWVGDTASNGNVDAALLTDKGRAKAALRERRKPECQDGAKIRLNNVKLKDGASAR